MPTQIIDGFKVNVAAPIDTRLVTSGQASRNSLQYKYDGLRIFDTVDKKAYVWYNKKWNEETSGTNQSNTTSVIAGVVGKPGFIAKFDTPAGVTNSVIREQNMGGGKYFVGINVTKSLTYQLEVGGTVAATEFVGSMDGVYILPATLGINKITPTQPDNKTYQLKCINGTNQWVLESTTATKMKVTNDQVQTSGLVTFVGAASDNAEFFVNDISASRGLRVNPSTGQFIMSCDPSNGPGQPAYAFIDNNDSGLYGELGTIGLSYNGSKRVTIDSEVVNIFSGGASVATFGEKIYLKKDVTVNASIVLNGGFKLSATGNVSNYILTANAFGVGTWQSTVKIGLPVGAIVIWNNSSIPTGYKKCDGTGKIYIGGSYRQIPDLRDRNIMGSTDMSTTGAYGSASPKTPATATLNVSNLPRHKHYLSQANYTNDTINAAQKITIGADFTGEEVTTNSAGSHSHGYKMDGAGDGGSSIEQAGNVDKGTSNHSGAVYPAGAHTHKVTAKGKVSVSVSGYTDDASTLHGNIGQPFSVPHVKGYEVIFIIKYDPAAAPSTEGHYTP